METWWSEIDGDILGCLERHGGMSPQDIAHKLGMSEGEVTAFVSGLAREGKVRLTRVELAGEAAARPDPTRASRRPAAGTDAAELSRTA